MRVIAPCRSTEPVAEPVRFDIIDISVVVPIYNRPLQLRRLLGALSRQDYPRERFEVLVCDDGSDENLTDVVREAAAGGLQVRYLRQRRRGPGAARNLGLACGRGEIVAFTDSDCVPCASWLSAIAAAMAEPDTGLVGGRVGYEAAEQITGRCLNFLMSSSLGAAGARDPRCVVSMRYYPRTCNLAVRRDLAVAADGFPDAWHGEDLEFGHRVRQRGALVHFVKDAGVVHDERRSWRQVFQEAYLKGRARVRLDRCCGMHQTVHALPAALVVYLVGLILTIVFWPAVVAVASLPGVAYLIALCALTLRGAWRLREVPATLLVPVLAFTIHVGYGLGYLTARLGPGAGALAKQSVDWKALRAAGDSSRLARSDGGDPP